jgi:hypothetical protein
MARFLDARLRKVEARATKTAVRATVLEIDPTTRQAVGRLPNTRRVMVVTRWPSERAWAEALTNQQTRLTNEGTPT